MIEVQPFEALGRFQNEWLNARHHFSFGHYHDPARMNVGALRVWNDDEIAPGKGFDPHPHREMEIVTYIREGAITHKDSLGNVGRTEAGDVQVMHAGTGIVHAEYNMEATPTRLFQIWLVPNKARVAPGWGTREFPKERSNALHVLADGRDTPDSTALPLYADGAVLAGTVQAGQSLTQAIGRGRIAYLVAATGRVRINGIDIGTRDGVTVRGEEAITIEGVEDAEIVLVDVAA
ncbi:MAG: pirin family protein [Acetobacteraceae bacterium]|nr:pirin family protein [Acetobacteraceae bacterium]